MASMRSTRPHLRAIVAITVVLLIGVFAAVPGTTGAAKPRAHAAASYLTGIGDEQTLMFTNPLWRQLHTRIVRYIAPYDAVVHPYSLQLATEFIRAAEAQHEQILISFYHSEYSPTRLPSVALYQHDVQKFVRRFPHVKQYQSWDEANRGNVPHLFSSPSAVAAARYYQALIRVCHGCTVIGLDVLDAANISPTLRYISEFKHEIGRLRTIMPRIWGLHNYSDINRLESWRTRALRGGLRRPGVADRDGRVGQVRRRLSQSQRLRADARGARPQVHVRGRRIAAANQAPLHLQLDRRHALDAL